MILFDPLEVPAICRIGIMGGTFDPIHIGHLFIAAETLEKLSLDKIIFIPAGVSPHKINSKTTSPIHRLLMTAIAVNSNKSFYLSDIEIEREGPSYTIDTIRSLKQLLPEAAELFFITGGDTFIDLDSWRDYGQLLQLANFVVFTRAGYDNGLLDEKILRFRDEFSSNITKISIPLLEVSSTDIRERAKMGRTMKYLIPEGVEEYILKNRLYKDLEVKK